LSDPLEPSGKRRLWHKFVLPDGSTKYVPCYPVQSPDIGWQSKLIEQAPNLNAARLAESWDATAMREALQPLGDGYGAWINQQQAKVSDLEPR
jgi:hypothetical protein